MPHRVNSDRRRGEDAGKPIRPPARERLRFRTSSYKQLFYQRPDLLDYRFEAEMPLGRGSEVARIGRVPAWPSYLSPMGQRHPASSPAFGAPDRFI